MTNEEKIIRLRNIQKCTHVHTIGDVRDIKTLEAAIEDIAALDKIKSRLGIFFKELEERISAENSLIAVSGMSVKELTDAFIRGYRLVSPEKNDQIPDPRVTAEEAAEALQNLTKAGISQE